MISIQSAVEKIIKEDAEAYIALKRGIINFSQYAYDIHGKIEKICKKEVKHGSIVIALTRIESSKKHGLMKTYAPIIKIDNITTKLPVVEIVYDKTPKTLAKLSQILDLKETKLDDFFVMTLGTKEITIICSQNIISSVKKVFNEQSKIEQNNLVAIGLSFSEEYYKLPNITFSLIRELALKEIVIAETVSSYTEVIFICHQKDLNNILESFTTNPNI